MLDLYEIIRKYSPRMNTNIVAEVKNLSLLELADALRTVYEPWRTGAQLNGFGAALDAFEGTADRLTILRDEHDRWQLIEDDLRREADQLPTRGVDPFRRRWERTLGASPVSANGRGAHRTVGRCACAPTSQTLRRRWRRPT